MQPIPPASDRRLYPRHPVLAQVRVKNAAADLVMDVKNLSMSGALVDMGQLDRPSWLKAGRAVEITLVILDSDQSVDLTGTVVRVIEDLSSQQFAVRFASVNDEAREFLDRLITTGASLPPPAGR